MIRETATYNVTIGGIVIDQFSGRTSRGCEAAKTKAIEIAKAKNGSVDAQYRSGRYRSSQAIYPVQSEIYTR